MAKNNCTEGKFLPVQFLTFTQGVVRLLVCDLLICYLLELKNIVSFLL